MSDASQMWGPEKWWGFLGMKSEPGKPTKRDATEKDRWRKYIGCAMGHLFCVIFEVSK